MNRWLWLVLTVLMLGLVACGSSEEVETESKAEGDSEAETLNVVFRDAPLAIDADFHNDSADFVAATGRPQLLEFYTDWCPTCKSMKSTVHTLEAEYWGKIDFVYLDREEDVNKDWVETYGVRGQPVFVLIQPDGTVVEQWFGGVSGETLTAALDDYLAQAGG